LRAEGIFNSNTVFNPVPGATFNSPYFSTFTDSIFIDKNLSTSTRPYSYQLQFFVNNQSKPYGLSFPASTVFLKAAGSDRQVQLNWEVESPWNNFNYEIWRKSPTTNFEMVGNSNSRMFRDRQVTNDIVYCYKIQSMGTYGIPGLPSPILNFSQEICALPVDTVAPCVPLLSIARDCIAKDPDGSTVNELTWSFGNTDTCFIDDLKGFNIYFKKNSAASAFTKIITLEDPSINTIKHTPDSGFTGCYIITSVDHKGNESRLVNEVCPSNCTLEYELANSFTPNGDGSNDLYIPRINSGVLRIEFQVYNRWGEVLFETENPAISWNGQDKKGRDLTEGTYYYICRIFGFQENTNQIVEDRKGFIQIMR
jgi:gliding motility-associated-like protein